MGKSNKPTDGKWEFACDSYGKVLHSKKACVYSPLKGPNGEILQTVASRIENWADARLIAASKELLSSLKQIRDARDEHAKSGKLPDAKYECFDDWAADVADSAIKLAEGE